MLHFFLGVSGQPYFQFNFCIVCILTISLLDPQCFLFNIFSCGSLQCRVSTVLERSVQYKICSLFLVRGVSGVPRCNVCKGNIHLFYLLTFNPFSGLNHN